MSKSKIIMLLAVISGAFGILFCSKIASEGALHAINISVNNLIPGIFPFMAIGCLFVKLGGGVICQKLFGKIFGKIFNVSGKCTLPFIVGLISGYPTAAAVTVSAVKRGEISKDEAEEIIGWCCNPGIIFTLSNSENLPEGITVWCSVVIASIITGIISGRKKTIRIIPKNSESGNISCARCFVDSVKEATANIIVICGFVVFFGTYLSILDTLPIWRGVGDSNVIKATVFGMIEIVSGCNKLLGIALPVTLRVPLMSMLFAWSGICVHMQIAAISEECKLNMKKYLKNKFISCVTAPVISFVLLKVVPVNIPVSYITPTHNPIKVFTVSFVTAILLWIILLWTRSVFSQNKILKRK